MPSTTSGRAAGTSRRPTFTASGSVHRSVLAPPIVQKAYVGTSEVVEFATFVYGVFASKWTLGAGQQRQLRPDSVRAVRQSQS